MPRSHLRSVKITLALSSLVVLAACGGSSTAADPATPPASAPQPGAVLIGSIGTPGNPDEYVIDLTGQDGTSVTTLAAGSYTVQVSDESRIHNFHLTGPGVSESTSVVGTGDSTFQVTFTAGSYTYVCDPHTNMQGTFTVV